MTENSAIFTQVWMICGTGIFLIVGIILSTSKFKKRTKHFGIYFALLGALALCFASTTVAFAYQNYYFSRSLQPQEISEIYIADQTITDSTTIEKLAQALHDVQLYMPNHESPPEYFALTQIEIG